MPDQTSALSLPLILPSQAQKHVTHNEALRILDAVVQLSVKSRSLTDPPAAPVVGDRYIVKGPPGGAWAGHLRDVAIYTEDGWQFHNARTGWRAYVEDEVQLAVFDGTNWVVLGDEVLSTEMLGINATADAVNRLVMKGDAALFDADGNGLRVKLNKSTNTSVASLLFQVDHSARAELGLIGSENLDVKVSTDGTTFEQAVSIDVASGLVRCPIGLRLGPGTETAPTLAFMGDANTGVYNPSTNQLAVATAGIRRATFGASGLDATNLLRDGSQVFSRDNVVGAVSQAGGVPTGAVVESGSNANGSYTRWADGTLVCMALRTLSHASSLRLQDSWNFPMAFDSAPAISISPSGNGSARDLRDVGAFGYLGLSSNTVALNVYRAASSSAFLAGETWEVCATAWGRWY